jgi:hypothetical protein
MMRFRTISGVVLTCAVAVSSPAVARETELKVVVSDSQSPTLPGSTVSFEVEVANAGPDEPYNSVVLDVYLPMEVPVPYRDYLAADADGRQAIADAFLDGVVYDENIWDPNDEESVIFVGDSRNNECEGMILQFSHLTLPAQTFGTVSYDATLPEVGVAGFAYRKADGEMVYSEFLHSACADPQVFEDCGDANGVFCMGARLTTVVASGAPITLVNDGSDAPSEGCLSLVDFPSGNVALIDRGTCSFQDKVKNASDAGASGVIVANYAGGGDVDEDGLILMGCNSDATCIELLMPAPAVFISHNTGLALKADMAEGEAHGFVGIRQEEPNFAVTEGYIREWGGTPDYNPDNNRFTRATVFGEGIFSEGFESGDTSVWSDSEPLISTLYPGTWRWLIDPVCNGVLYQYTLIFNADGSFLSPQRCSGYEGSWTQHQKIIEFSFPSCDGIYTGELTDAGTLQEGTVTWGGCWQANWEFKEN